MIVQAKDMATAVRVAIDMNASSNRLLLENDIDTLEMDDIIYSKLADAVRLVEMEAPNYLLEKGHTFGDSVVWSNNSDGKGWVILPDDFLRLVTFRMSDWKRAVYSAISEDDELYSRQSSRFKGICGNPEKPVCAIVNRSEGKVLEFYSCNNNQATVDQAVYVKMPVIDTDGGIDVSEDCYRAAVYRAAALALATLNDPQSSTMLEISKSLLT